MVKRREGSRGEKGGSVRMRELGDRWGEVRGRETGEREERREETKINVDSEP
jgi:hypothetical protein